MVIGMVMEEAVVGCRKGDDPGRREDEVLTEPIGDVHAIRGGRGPCVVEGRAGVGPKGGEAGDDEKAEAENGLASS